MKKMMLSVVVLAITAVAVSVAVAQDETDTRPRRGPHPDANQDGQITLEEFLAAVPGATEERFTSHDTNGDGVLTPDERPKPPRRGQGRGGMGPGGEVTLEDFLAHAPGATEERFNSMDTNGDGVLTQDERPRGPRGPRGGDGDDGQGGRRQGRGRGTGGPGALDTNGDGQVTFEEAAKVIPSLTQERFDARDRNGDGVWSREDHTGGGRGNRSGGHGRGRQSR